MTETRAVSIEDVRMLVAERQRYDDWLAALEARRAETPARVFERVHGDYSGRRTAVVDQLRGHLAALAALGDELDARLSTVDSGLSTLEDERAEAMLRTAVGEFDGDRWEIVRQDVEAKIAEISAERTVLLAEVGDVRALLASARSEPEPTAVLAGGPATVSETSASALGAPDTSAQVDDTGTAGGEAGFLGSAELVEASERDSAVLRVAAEMPSAIAMQSDPNLAEEGEAGSAAAREEADLEDALALFTPERTGHAPAPDAGPIDLDGIEPIDDGAPDRSQDETRFTRTATMTPPSPAMPAGGQAAAPTLAPADADPFDDLAFLRSVTDASAAGASASGRGTTNTGTEPQKTLRCTECGTMNFPTEWYCERCGGELAAF
jgi:hypothetical protein